MENDAVLLQHHFMRFLRVNVRHHQSFTVGHTLTTVFFLEKHEKQIYQEVGNDKNFGNQRREETESTRDFSLLVVWD